jgi:hypothetical protein
MQGLFDKTRKLRTIRRAGRISLYRIHVFIKKGPSKPFFEVLFAYVFEPYDKVRPFEPA